MSVTLATKGMIPPNSGGSGTYPLIVETITVRIKTVDEIQAVVKQV